jgi:hypothetical protein
MTKTLRFLAALLLAFPAFAQAQRTYSQPELDQMLAPIALYPDALLAQVLMAATYPAALSEAARWSRANPGLQGDDAVRAVEHEDWDPSVKSLVAFPQVLARMAENPGWTQSLGDAFLAQESHVMDTVQHLRRRAQAAGNLQSSEQIRIQQHGAAIAVQSASPQYVYVPYYDPLVVYGPWWWPAYRPIAWAPGPRPSGIRISPGFFFGNFDWHRRQVRVVHPSVYHHRPPVVVSRTAVVTPHRWQQEHRVERQPVQVQPQVRMPAAVAPLQPRAQQHDPRHEHRSEPRNERGHKGRERS